MPFLIIFNKNLINNDCIYINKISFYILNYSIMKNNYLPKTILLNLLITVLTPLAMVSMGIIFQF